MHPSMRCIFETRVAESSVAGAFVARLAGVEGSVHLHKPVRRLGCHGDDGAKLRKLRKSPTKWRNSKSLYRGLTGTLAVGQDGANLLAKHLLQDLRIPICNSGKLI